MIPISPTFVSNALSSAPLPASATASPPAALEESPLASATSMQTLTGKRTKAATSGHLRSSNASAVKLHDWSLQHCHGDGEIRLRGFTENHPIYRGPQTICTSPVKAIAFLEVPDQPSTLFGWTPKRLAAVTENNLYDLGQFKDGYEFVSALADQGINLPLYFLREAM